MEEEYDDMLVVMERAIGTTMRSRCRNKLDLQHDWSEPVTKGMRTRDKSGQNL